MTDDGIYSGTTSSVLTMNPASPLLSGAYTCAISNVAGTVITTPATVTIGTPPTITFPPQPQNAAVGRPVALTVYVDGSEPLAFQWRKDGATLSDNGRITGSATSTLSLDPAAAGDSGLYTVTISNTCGSVTTEPALVTITGCGSADFNHDGDIGTDQDIEAFFRCLAGNCCAACGTADFNGDGDIGTDQDIEAFFRVLAGGDC